MSEACSTPDWLPDEHGAPQLRHPRSVADLVNFQLHLIEATNSSTVIRICEGEFGITRREWLFLALLAAFGAMAPSQVATRAGLDRSRTSKGLVSLLAKGLVERQPHPADGRRATVALTTAGRELYSRIFPRVRKVNTDLLAVLSNDEVQTLAQLLARLQARAFEIDRAGHTAKSADRRGGGSLRVWEREHQWEAVGEGRLIAAKPLRRAGRPGP